MLSVSDIFRSDVPADAPLVPDDLRERMLRATVKAALDPDHADALLSEARPVLAACKPDLDFTISCGLVAETISEPGSLVPFWNDLHGCFPLAPTPVKLLMREYRRDGFVAFGLIRLNELFPDAGRNLNETIAFLAGLAGLGLTPDIDSFVALKRAGLEDELLLLYAGMLRDQRRFKHALAVLLRIGPETRRREDVTALRSQIMVDLHRQVRRQNKPKLVVPRKEVIPRLVHLAGDLTRPLDVSTGLGPVVFFTGQLGPGGAERQMSRMAAELHRRQVAGEPVGVTRLAGPVHVCLRQVDPRRNSDFFLPVLREAGLEPALIDAHPVPGEHVLAGLPDGMADLLMMLRKGLRELTLKLMLYFRETRPDVAYLWQDGGALAAGLAALIAGTPRIVVSFRGLPPNKRPDRMREEMPALFRAMIDLPQLTFTANSAAVARDYENWLELPEGTISVIPNAVQHLLSEGDAADRAFWEDMVARSPECRRTVIGVFRFEANKRPETWVEAAAAYALRDPSVRFLIVGGGVEAVATKAWIERHGMENRIFLAGMRKSVGFFLYRSDLMMHLARTEGLPNVIIEAQMCGLPVLATPAGGTGEIVQDGVTGRLLPSAETVEAQDVAGALQDILGDSAQLEQMGRLAVSLSTPKYNLDSLLQTTLDHFTTPIRQAAPKMRQGA
jgi:glycosyltransferase involved in cell wall biosynthesis